jgi:hypothetical protein
VVGRFADVEASPFSKQSTHEWRLGVNFTCRSSFTPNKFPGTHFCWRPSLPRVQVQLKELGKFENPVASTGIEPADFRLLVQCLNHLQCRCSLIVWYHFIVSRTPFHCNRVSCVLSHNVDLNVAFWICKPQRYILRGSN